MTELLAALVGTIVGGFISWLAANSNNKLQPTFELHREFGTNPMYEFRMLADQLLRENPHDALDKIFERYPKDSISLWQLATFYQRLWLAIKLNQVKVSLIPELFGEVFIWWYVNFFEKQFLPVYRDCSTGKQISIGKQIIDLRNWLDLHSNKSELYEWTQKALRDYERKMNIQN